MIVVAVVSVPVQVLGDSGRRSWELNNDCFNAWMVEDGSCGAGTSPGASDGGMVVEHQSPQY